MLLVVLALMEFTAVRGSSSLLTLLVVFFSFWLFSEEAAAVTVCVLDRGYFFCFDFRFEFEEEDEDDDFVLMNFLDLGTILFSFRVRRFS